MGFTSPSRVGIEPGYASPPLTTRGGGNIGFCRGQLCPLAIVVHCIAPWLEARPAPARFACCFLIQKQGNRERHRASQKTSLAGLPLDFSPPLWMSQRRVPNSVGDGLLRVTRLADCMPFCLPSVRRVRLRVRGSSGMAGCPRASERRYDMRSEIHCIIQVRLLQENNGPGANQDSPPV